MTTGNWTFGDSMTPLFARKAWNGVNGKTEPWFGGTRDKWNSYTMVHHSHIQTGIGNVVGPVHEYFASDVKALVGWTANDDLNLLDKLAQTVRGHSFDLGINLAEAGKTYQTILQNLRSIGSALYDLKHGDFYGAAKTLGAGQVASRPSKAKTLSGRWLETQYAFLPLVDQSYESAKALKALTHGRSMRFSARSRTFRAVVDESSSPAGYSYKCTWTYSKKINADLYEELSIGRSLGLTNPAAIAWELVPYSFVIDWFIPIGTYLSAWGVIPALNGRFLTIERIGTKGGKVGAGSVGNGNSYKSQNKKETFFRITRTPSSSLSIPTPTFKSLPKALSPRHLLNAVALAHQRLR